MRHTRWMTVVALALMVGAAAVAQDVEMIESHLGNEGPAFQEGTTPSSLEWGPDDQAYPDRFVVYPDDGSELVWVPPGSFPMGSTAGEGHRDERPRRDVEITSGFWIGKHVVTNAQYRAFCVVTAHEFPEDSDQGDEHPVTHVTWDDAVAYAEHYGLSLPTEAQWEYAARGPEGHIYPWGDEWDPEKLCWDENRGPGGRTFPVGSFAEGASWSGALDMSGNVKEWCVDWYDYYRRDAPAQDPSGPSETQAPVMRILVIDCEGRVIGDLQGKAMSTRGSDWIHSPVRSRSASRDCMVPSFGYYRLGFRITRTP